MKHIINHIVIIAALISIVSCNNLVESAETLVNSETQLILHATREGLTSDTKSFCLDGGAVWWNPKEEVSVFYGSGTNGGSKFTSMNTSIAEIVELEGSVQMSESGKEFWAVYPYSADNSCDGSSVTTVIPAIQTGVEGNFSDDVFPAIANSKTLDLAFWNICGGVKFFVSRTDIKSVTIKGNNGETLAGKVKVAFNAEGYPEVTDVMDGKAEATLNAPDGGCFKPGKYYYITLLPTTLIGGITLTFSTASEIGTLTSDKAQTVKRSIFGVLNNADSKVTEWESTVVEPEYVDLGLSVKWATFNVGASKPEEYGDLFAFGELEPHHEPGFAQADPPVWRVGFEDGYWWTVYKWCNGTENTLTKYNTESSRGIADYKIILDSEDDVANVSWGDKWHIPTVSQFEELCKTENCNWTWTTRNGVSGYEVTSKIEGYTDKSIFLPAPGYRRGQILYNSGAVGRYWSSCLPYTSTREASFLYLYSAEHKIGHDYRDYGVSVRPVYGDYIPVSSISLDKHSLELFVGDTAELSAVISPSNASEPAIHWTSDNWPMVSVMPNGTVMALKEGTTNIIVYSTNGLTEICTVTVKAKPVPEAVDLGLSVKWASSNLGAYKPEEYGDYFAWGETEPKTQYSWSTYIFANGSDKKLIKYCPEDLSSFWDGNGVPDGITNLEAEDDAAQVILGSNWRMPTEAEWEELIDNCTWTWTDDYEGTGVAGRIVKSNLSGYTDNSIFFPVAGYRTVTYLYYDKSYGYYWSSSLYEDDPRAAWYLYFGSGSVSMSSDRLYRNLGFSVRPVLHKN